MEHPPRNLGLELGGEIGEARVVLRCDGLQQRQRLRLFGRREGGGDLEGARWDDLEGRDADDEEVDAVRFAVDRERSSEAAKVFEGKQEKAHEATALSVAIVRMAAVIAETWA